MLAISLSIYSFLSRYSILIKTRVDEASDGAMSVKTVNIATSAAFAAIAILIGFLPASFPFPIIPYLRFDLAEIPVVIAFLGFGPTLGFLTLVSYFIVLLAVGEFSPIGPALKFIAVLGMLLGLWASSRIAAHRGRLIFLLVGGLFAALIRVLLTTLANYVVLAILMPQFLEFAAGTLRSTLGIVEPTFIGQLIVVLLFTAVFNIIHVAFSLVPSVLITDAVTRHGVFLRQYESWISRISRPFTEKRNI